MRLPIALLFVAWLPFVPQAMAQGGGNTLEEVIVTAQHREESAMATPISLFTLNSEQLEQQRIGSISDLNGMVPNLNIDAFPADNQTLRLFIRGIGLSDTQITQDPAVGVYLNGAYIARSAGLTFDVADLERIEVLRGPQGTLYGRNTTGGAIKLITKKPNLDALTFDETLSAGNNDLFSTKTSVNVPFADKYAVKLAYFHKDVDGFTNNDGEGGGFGDRTSDGARLDFRADATDTLTFNYGYDYSKIKAYAYAAQAEVPRPSDGSYLSLIGDIAKQYVDYSSNRFSTMSTSVPLLPTDVEISGHTLNTDWIINDNTTLHSITAYRQLDDKAYVDFGTGSSSPDFRIDYNSAVIGAEAGAQRMDLPAVRADLSQWQVSQEFQLLGNITNEIQYVAGLYYFHEEGKDDERPLHHIFNAYPFVGGTIYDLSSEYNKIDNSASAVFTQFTWTPDILENRLHLTLGGRYSKDSREAYRTVTDETVIDYVTSVKPLTSDYFSANPDHSWDDFSYTFITEYDVQDHFNVYAKYADAYQSGGFNIRDPDEAGFSNGFKPETLGAWEVGLKGEALDRRVRLNTDIFYQKFTDYQYNFQIPGTISGTRVFNINNGEMSGLEIELMAVPATGVFLQASYAYLDSSLDDVLNPFTGLIQEASFGSAPKNTYSFVAGYTVPVTDIGVINANASYNYVGKQDPHSTTTYRDDYDLVNARVALSEIPGLSGQWEVALWGKNLTDNNYVQFALDNLPQANRAVIWGDGRSYGLDVTYRYF